MNLSIYLLSIIWALQFSSPDDTHLGDDQQPLVYPNPAKSFVHVASENVQNVALYTITGDEVKGEWVRLKDSYRLDVRELANGLYFVKIHTVDGKDYTERLAIEGH